MHNISVVIPVYQGAKTLPDVIAELLPLTQPQRTQAGRPFVVHEVLLVHDNGPDSSDVTMRQLAAEHDVVRNVWLSRNYGQHAATLAGMASSGGDWIVTMDEDGQHNPAFIANMLDVAMARQASVVYGQPMNAAPHGFVRNLASRTAKKVTTAVSGLPHASEFQSFRLVLGDIGRSVAAYAGHGVYLDVALGWVTNSVANCPVELREEGDRPSGYTFKSLFAHFWRMLLTSGTRGLRAVSVLGGAAAVLGVLVAIWFVLNRLLFHEAMPSGWASLMVGILVMGGLTLLSLGIIAEYIGINVNMAMGKPLYLIVPDRADGPLGRQDCLWEVQTSTDGTRAARPRESAASSGSCAVAASTAASGASDPRNPAQGSQEPRG